ncbi:MAG: Fe-S cluster assembly protein IscX [Pseudomonadota bacterium]|nr:Fe-S cluster assembly protein IscX [Pseudomonadota bacterium]|tara:strand:- start:16 stop:213 length:198 start_codon:yes stop_codon:yes gene_type:complete
MKWNDVYDIAMALADQYPDTDPQYVNFVDLHGWVCGLEDFDDDPNRSGEKILEAIQAAWIEEAAD